MPEDIAQARPTQEVKPVSTQETLQIMQHCSEEIRQLRGQVAVLQPKAEAYDLLLKIMGLLPGQSRGYGEDMVWKLEKRIAELQSTLIKDTK